MREIHDHGPISCGVDANWMLHYPDDCHSVITSPHARARSISFRKSPQRECATRCAPSLPQGDDKACVVNRSEMVIVGPTANAGTNHVVSLVGWGTSPSGVKDWIGRNR